MSSRLKSVVRLPKTPFLIKLFISIKIFNFSVNKSLSFTVYPPCCGYFIKFIFFIIVILYGCVAPLFLIFLHFACLYFRAIYKFDSFYVTRLLSYSLVMLLSKHSLVSFSPLYVSLIVVYLTFRSYMCTSAESIQCHLKKPMVSPLRLRYTNRIVERRSTILLVLSKPNYTSPRKTEYMLLMRRQFIGPLQPILLGNNLVDRVESTRCLGTTFSENWLSHNRSLIQDFFENLLAIKQ